MSLDTMKEIALSAENDHMRDVIQAANKFVDELNSTPYTLFASPLTFYKLEAFQAALKYWNNWSKGESR